MRAPSARASRPKALLKYYALATAIVVAIAVVVAGYANFARIKLRIASVTARLPPKAGTRDAASHGGANVIGQAAWALSAFPECFEQRGIGSSRDADALLARVAQPLVAVRAPARLRFADCTISVRARSVSVTRGGDRLRVPGKSTLYESADARTLALLRVTGNRFELRAFHVVGTARP